MLEVAIIGAGLAGIHCTLALQQQGYKVALFDKSRGIGGRLATRRVEGIPLDHGLSSWQILGQHTQQLTDNLQRADLLQPWRVAQTDTNDPTLWQDLTPEPAWIAPAGMTAIAKHLAQGLTIHRAHLVRQIIEKTDHWQLIFDDDSTVAAAKLVLAVPFPQSLPLMPDCPTLSATLGITYAPALSLMLGYDALDFNPPWQELRLTDHPIFQKIIFDGQKRSPHIPTLVLQTHGTFTATYLDVDDLTPVTALLSQTIQALLSLPDPRWSQIHRWRYALPQTFLGKPCLNLETRLPAVACGDWCLGNGIEGAIASGYAAAAQISSLS